MLVGEGFQGGADHRIEVDIEYFRRGAVRGDQAPLAVQRQYARGQSSEHGFEIRTLCFDQVLALTGFVMRALELAGHLVERCDEESDLVLGCARELGLVIAAGDRLGALGEVLQGGDHAARRAERRVHCGEQADEQDDRQRQSEAQLQGLAKVRELPILHRRGLHAVRKRVHSFGDGKQRLEQPGLARCLVRRYRHHDLYVQSAVSDIVQTDVVAGPACLRHDGIARTARNHRSGVCVARADDESVRADESQLRRPAQAPGVVERTDRLPVGERLEIRCDSRGLREELAHANAERSPAEVQRIVERLLDAHVEPAVDTAVQKLQREVVDDCDRCDRQDHEDDDHSDRQLGARTAFSCLIEQVIQIPGYQHAETDQRHGIDCEQDRIELAESRGVLGGVAHEVCGSEQDQTQNDDRAGALSELIHCRTRHSNHPLFRRQLGLR